MKVAKGIDLYLDYHRLNSQKIRTGLTERSFQGSVTTFQTGTWIPSHPKKFSPFW
jgi:hypothetical protein